MSQRSRKSRKSFSQPSTSRANDNDYAMDESEAHGSRSQAPSSTQKNKMSDEEIAHYVANTVKYILAADRNKTPINKSLIPKAVDYHGKGFRTVMSRTEKVLEDVFGYKAVDDNGKIILVNKLENEFLKVSEDVGNKYVLLFFCLAHIYMSNEKVTESNLIDFLKKLSILGDDGNMINEQFGNVLNIIKEDFVKERYLEMIKPKGNDIENEEVEFMWGSRALVELPVRKVMGFVSMIYERDMESWPQQFNKMKIVEKEQKARLNQPLINEN
ncbi:hypothetical protein TKK_0003558 [Trichogramma kaykai]|uniref:MAGE domain-containing protein n=1 Tax=Trichogramma kaykai TaxID=54128 RepID=A0ABD2XPX7_9HYME